MQKSFELNLCRKSMFDLSGLKAVSIQNTTAIDLSIAMFMLRRKLSHSCRRVQEILVSPFEVTMPGNECDYQHWRNF